MRRYYMKDFILNLSLIFGRVSCRFYTTLQRYKIIDKVLYGKQLLIYKWI